MSDRQQDEQSVRAWSMNNSLFSANTSDTANTQASAQSQNEPKKLQVVEELSQAEDSGPAATVEKTVPFRTAGAMATTQTVPIARSVPLSRTVSKGGPSVPGSPADASAGSASGPATSNHSPLFGRPNMQIPIAPESRPKPRPVVQQSTGDAEATEKALVELRLALMRMLDSVLKVGRTSVVVTRATSAAQLIEDYCAKLSANCVQVNTCKPLADIIRTVLAFTDCLVRSVSLRSTRMALLRSFEMLGVALGLVSASPETPVPHPRNFGLAKDTIYKDLLEKVLAHTSREPISEQEGSYIAPVCRGLSPEFCVATLCIGIPHLTEQHWAQVTSLLGSCPELHFYVRRDFICPAQHQLQQKVVPPFRIPDPTRPPISVSIAPEAATHMSGTLGGYIYPVIDGANSQFEQFRDSTFALTCGHVCLENSDASRNIDKPVMIPSPVLTQMFRKALDSESKLHASHSFEYNAYREAINQLDQSPPKPLGSLVWGERAVVTAPKAGCFMSDMAIVKCDANVSCRNYLGDDINLASHDLGLMFEKTVTHTVPPELCPGLQVFKYGATTKYTSGIISSSRIIYWSNNRLQSTEFVVRGETPLFASGGDSGAWILARGSSTGSSGLGVVGMIHSYDGEFKEFGLFTPITYILERLQTVTSVPWSVVGVPTTGDPDPATSS